MEMSDKKSFHQNFELKKIHQVVKKYDLFLLSIKNLNFQIIAWLIRA